PRRPGPSQSSFQAPLKFSRPEIVISVVCPLETAIGSTRSAIGYDVWAWAGAADKRTAIAILGQHARQRRFCIVGPLFLGWERDGARELAAHRPRHHRGAIANRPRDFSR